MASRHLRDRSGNEQKTTNLELFFDLVFVFAVTQLSHVLLAELTLEGVGKLVLLLLVVWWAWIYTTWMSNVFDPDSVAVRMVLIAVMLAAMLMAVAIPDAFGDRAMLFACSYVALQVGRNAFTLMALQSGTPVWTSQVRILAWSVAAGILWIGGAAVGDPALPFVWVAALIVDYAGPFARYWTPRLGQAAMSDWDVEGTQFAERFQLFLIITLGETIVITGATAADLPLDAARAVAIGFAFLATAALWWLYFDFAAALSQARLAGLSALERGTLARDAFTYIHIPMIAGIIITAVGDELVIAHPTEHLHAAELAAVVAGPALYLLGLVAFRWRMVRSLAGKRLVAIGAILAVGVFGTSVPALVAAGLVLAVLVAVAAVETRNRFRFDPLVQAP